MCWVEAVAMGLVGAGAACPALEKASHGLTNLRLTLMFHHSQVRQSSRCPSLGQLPNPLPCASHRVLAQISQPVKNLEEITKKQPLGSVFKVWLSVGPTQTSSHFPACSQGIKESQNHLGWKSPLRSPSPTVPSAWPNPSLNRVPRCHIHTSFKSPQGW